MEGFDGCWVVASQRHCLFFWVAVFFFDCQVAEVVKTSAKTVLAEQKLAQMQALLKQPVSFTVLRSLLETWESLREAVRAVQLKKLSSELVEKLTAAAKDVMAGQNRDGLPLNSACLDVVLDGLTMLTLRMLHSGKCCMLSCTRPASNQ